MPVRELFERYHLRVFRFFRRLAGEDAAAEDLTQEVFLRALRSQSRYAATGRDEAWIFRIARNLWIDRLRRSRRRPAKVGEVPLHLGVPARQEDRMRLDEAIARLPDDEREAFLLREVGGLSYAQIATVCQASLEAVRSRIYRARRGLRRALVEHEEPRLAAEKT